jgi:hypothetical protein
VRATVEGVFARAAELGVSLWLNDTGDEVLLDPPERADRPFRTILQARKGQLIAHLTQQRTESRHVVSDLHPRVQAAPAHVAEPDSGRSQAAPTPIRPPARRGPPADNEPALPLPPAVIDKIPKAVKGELTLAPNVFFDHIFPRISNGELRVLLFFIRQYYGWHHEERGSVLSYQEISTGFIGKEGRADDEGCGLGLRYVKAMVAKLLIRGLLVREDRRDRYGRCLASRFRLNVPDRVAFRDQEAPPKTEKEGQV